MKRPPFLSHPLALAARQSIDKAAQNHGAYIERLDAFTVLIEQLPPASILRPLLLSQRYAPSLTTAER